MSSATIIIAGYGPGISNAVATKFGKEKGYSVALLSRSQSKLDKAAHDLAGLGVKAQGFAVDLTDSAAVLKTIQAVQEALGDVHVLFWNGGALINKGALEATGDDYQSTFRSHVESLAVSANALQHELEKSKGAILVTGGGLSLETDEFVDMAVQWGLATAAVAKAAQRKLVHILHRALKPRGVFVGEVTVHAVVRGTPGFDPEGKAPLTAEQVRSCARKSFRHVCCKTQILSTPGFFHLINPAYRFRRRTGCRRLRGAPGPAQRALRPHRLSASPPPSPPPLPPLTLRSVSNTTGVGCVRWEGLIQRRSGADSDGSTTTWTRVLPPPAGGAPAAGLLASAPAPVALRPGRGGGTNSCVAFKNTKRTGNDYDAGVLRMACLGRQRTRPQSRRGSLCAQSCGPPARRPCVSHMRAKRNVCVTAAPSVCNWGRLPRRRHARPLSALGSCSVRVSNLPPVADPHFQRLKLKKLIQII